MQPPARTTNDAVFTAEQAKRGQVLYQPQCAACHGQTLAGAEAAPALAGPAFAGSWNEAPSEISSSASGLDAAGQTRVAQPPADREIVAYILSVNKAPAGQTELPGDTEALKAIKIVPAK